MDPGKITAAILAAPFIVYVVGRLITAAYFKSKQDYERNKNHDRTNTPRPGPQQPR